ncbi:hypothetical protein OAS39_10195 [Pirellulales bacterium]|nr:hypothetical protein [Pirellulales bacterium]
MGMVRLADKVTEIIVNTYVVRLFDMHPSIEGMATRARFLVEVIPVTGFS